MIDDEGKIPNKFKTKKFAQRILPKDGEIKDLQLPSHPCQMTSFITNKHEHPL